MGVQSVNIGTIANDGTGDTLRQAFNKYNQTASDLFKGAPIALTDTLFGAVGDGVANDGDALLEWRDYLNANGGIYNLGSGTYLNSGNFDLTLTPTKPTLIISNGATFLRGTASIGGGITIDNTAGVPFQTMGQITINPKSSLYANSTHGLILINGGGVVIDRLHIEDWDSSAILAYPTGSNSGRALIERVTADGLGVAKNGILYDSYLNSVIQTCYVKGVGTASPGYALQIKNLGENNQGQNLIAEDSYVGFAIGQTEEVGAKESIFSNLIANNCIIGIIAGFAEGVNFDNFKINMRGSTNTGASHAIRMQHSRKVIGRGSIRESLANRHLIFFEEADLPVGTPRVIQDCVFDLYEFENLNGGTAGGNVPLVRFGTNVENCVVRFMGSDRMSALATPSFTVQDDNGVDSGKGNRIFVDGSEIYAS